MTAMTDTATDVITELKDWLNDNWDPDLTVAEWWERLGLAGWAAPGLPKNADRVIVDPPRGGLTLALRGAIMKALPRRLTYVSCHPATLARDLRRLLSAYRLESLTLLDMFPQSGHMEVIAQLDLIQSDQTTTASRRA